MANLELYELPGCPFCAKVVDKLDELGLDYETHEVPSVAYLEKTYGDGAA
jgi:glutaredoxin